MSEKGTRCNHCTLIELIADAKRDGATITMSFEHPDRRTLERWTIVHRSDREEPIALFRMLTTHCVC